MSRTTVLAVTPNQRPRILAELPNAFGWSSSIWRRLLIANGRSADWMTDSTQLNWLWRTIETQPEWQQAPNVLTFDTGVIPWQAYGWAADQLDEFERRCPAPQGHANHVPAVAEVLRSKPECPFVGVWGTSVTENPFDPWDDEADAPGHGIPPNGMYVLERHRQFLPPRDPA